MNQVHLHKNLYDHVSGKNKTMTPDAKLEEWMEVAKVVKTKSGECNE